MSKDKTVIDLGRALMRGALVEITKWLCIGFLGLWFGMGVASALGWLPFDSTDDQANHVRSGLRPLTDRLTGCQYLVNHDGSLTQRMGRDGRQICGAERIQP